MQTRILACMAGGLIGVVLTSTINVSLGFTPTLAVIACSTTGMAVGYVASLLYDVFVGTGKSHLNSLK